MLAANRTGARQFQFGTLAKRSQRSPTCPVSSAPPFNNSSRNSACSSVGLGCRPYRLDADHLVPHWLSLLGSLPATRMAKYITYIFHGVYTVVKSPWFLSVFASILKVMQKRKTLENRDPLLKALGERIRTLREAKGIAQEVFAYEAGIDRSYYGAVERGQYSPTAINLAKIAVALNVEAGELFPSVEELRQLLQVGEARS
jgi:DNA-binding XRE family transcriptional regulator